MDRQTGPSSLEHVAALPDPRVARTKRYPLLRVMAIAICAVVAGAERWDAIARFGKTTADRFASVLDLPHGILSGILDVVLREDAGRIRARQAAETVVNGRHSAHNLLRQQTTQGSSLKAKRLRADWDTQFLVDVLCGAASYDALALPTTPTRADAGVCPATGES